MDIGIRNNVLSQFKGQIIDAVIDALKGGTKLEDCIYSPKKIIEGDRPPLIAPLKGVENEYIIYYPTNSTSYPHKLDGIKKEVHILIGEIHEKRCNKTFVQGDDFTIPSNQDYEPYTRDQICIAHIKMIED